MINCYVKGENGLELGGTGIGSLADDSIWIDLNEPTVDEDNAVERHYSLDVPTGDEMRDLETSNRLYVENDLLYMTITLAISVDTPLPETTAVSFIVSPARLITVRYADSVPFKRWLSYAGTHAAACTTPLAIFSGLMQSVIERLAEVLEQLGRELDALSAEIFSDEADHGSFNHRDAQLRDYVQQLGRKGNLLSKVRESLVSLGRAMTFAQQPSLPVMTPEGRRQLATVHQDVVALAEHASFVSGKIQFLLDATLGNISIQQNRLLNIFSIAAVVLMPPTLIAGIYGMNFEFMPELKWHYGYPIAIIAMVLSAIGPLWYLRHREYL